MEMKMNDEAVRKIMGHKVFNNASVKIAGQFNTSLDEAKANLMYEISSHRGVLQVVGNELTAHQLAHINFAKKDILRHTHNQDVKEQEIFMPAETNEGVNLIDLNFDGINVADHTSFSNKEIERVIEVLPLIYQKRTAIKIAELLTVGEEQSKLNHGMETKTFHKDLKRYIAIANKPESREKLDNVLFTDKELIEKKNRQLAQSFLDMIEQDTSDEWFSTWFKIIEDNEWFDEAFDFIKNPKNMVENWDKNTQARTDGYEFISELRYLLNE